MNPMKDHMQYWLAYVGADDSIAIIHTDRQTFQDELTDYQMRRAQFHDTEHAALLNGYSHPYAVLILSDIAIDPNISIQITHIVNSQTFRSSPS